MKTSARCDTRKARRRGRASRTSSCHCGTRRERSISDAFTKQVQQALNNLQDKQGVTIRFIGYTDDAPLTGRDESVYGNQLVIVEGKGATGRIGNAKNPGITCFGDRERRSWSLPSACLQRNRAGTDDESSHRSGILVRRSSSGVTGHAATVPGRYRGNSNPEFTIPPGAASRISSSRMVSSIIPPDYAANLHRALTDIADRTNARLRFIGYTKNERLDRRTASVYDDDIGLSAARARHAMDIAHEGSAIGRRPVRT